MDSNSSHPLSRLRSKPERLTTLASRVKFTGGNTLLHRLVLENSHLNDSCSGHYMNAVLLSMSYNPQSMVNALNDDGYSALHLAVSKNNLTMVKKLLSFIVSVDVNARCGRDDGNTALHLAVELRQASIVRELLNKGAGVTIMNRRAETALSVAMRLHALDLVKIFLSADVNKHTSFNAPIHEATYFGSLKIVEYLIDRGADIHVRDRLGCTPLFHAAKGGYLDIVKLLIGKGADVNAADRFGFTPLHAAAVRNRLECVVFLLNKGAHLHSDLFGMTPLHTAAHAGHVDVVRALLDRGADVNTKNGNGKTPLDLAREKRNESCIHVLENVKVI